MPVYKLVEEMPYEELLTWTAYFERRPVDWRADERAYRLMQVQGTTEKSYNIFPSLDAIYNYKQKLVVLDDQAALAQSLVGSSMLSKLLGAQGGERLKI